MFKVTNINYSSLTVLVLGDSSSMTVGLERKTYPFLLADKPMWRNGAEIVNCSQAGFVSSDACAFFFRHFNDFYNLGAVIIYLGNNDGYASELRKGSYTFGVQCRNTIKELVGIGKPKNLLKNKLLHLEWNSRYDASIEKPEEPSDFIFNINRIIDHCSRRLIHVILVRPVANELFPSGMGKGNFIFYKYIDMHEKIASKLHISDKRFLEALSRQEEGDYLKAKDIYEGILKSPHHMYSQNTEYYQIVDNNIAVCYAELFQFDEAESLLKRILSKDNCRKEIILFNLAQICRMKGDEAKYKNYMRDSYETDCSLYRIKSVYAEAIEKVAARYPHTVTLINMNEFASHGSFVDYCHMLPATHGILAEKIANRLSSLRITGGNKAAGIRNILYNSWLSLGDVTDFYTYCRMNAPITTQGIKKEVAEIKRACLSHSSGEGCIDNIPLTISEEMRSAISYYLRHPCFPTIKDIIRFAPEHPSHIGRFPEFFLICHIVPYLKLGERENLFSSIFSNNRGLLHTSKELISILPDVVARTISTEDALIDPLLDEDRVDRILARVKKELLGNLRSGNKVHERLKLTIFWYFRETLRWGSHSRITMRYDRLLLEYIAEALAVARILDSRLSGKRMADIALMSSWVEEADRIHFSFCSRVALKECSKELLKNYDVALSAHADMIETQFIKNEGVKRDD